MLVLVTSSRRTFLSAESDELVKVGWFIDSGATDHMLKDADCFSTLRRLETPVEIVVANGQKLRAEYCGDVSLYAVVGGVTKECVAKNVLYLPGLSCNLFSVKRVVKAGWKVCFDGEKAEIVKNGVVSRSPASRPFVSRAYRGRSFSCHLR